MKCYVKRVSILFITAILILLTCTTGCTTMDSKPYGKEKVIAYVKNEVPNEKYELVSVMQIEQKPANVEYTFKSKERDLTFKANSYLSNVGIDTSKTIFYQKAISCSYDDVVQALYYDRVV